MNRFHSFDPPPGRVFGQRVLELKEQGVSEEEAITVADVCFQICILNFFLRKNLCCLLILWW